MSDNTFDTTNITVRCERGYLNDSKCHFRMATNHGYAPPPYEEATNAPKYGSDIPPAGMNPETAYLPAAENGFIQSAGFEDGNVRNQFIRKVYSILSIQLVFTGVVIALFQMNTSMSDYIRIGLQPYIPVVWTNCFVLFRFLQIT